MAEELRPGLTGEAELVCGPEHAASRFGATGIEVFATAILVGLFENAALNAVDHLLPAGSQTVGTGMTFKHTAATPLGAKVRARAEEASRKHRSHGRVLRDLSPQQRNALGLFLRSRIVTSKDVSATRGDVA